MRDIATFWCILVCLTLITLTDSAFSAQDLRQAVKEGNLELVKKLIGTDPDLLRLLDDYGRSVLHESARAGKLSVTTFLLQKGCPVNQKDAAGYTPLLHACAGRFLDVIEMLLQNGADPNKSKNQSGATPLAFAASQGNLEMMKLLTRYGAVIHKDDLFLLHYAIMWRQRQSADYLLSQGISLPIGKPEEPVFLHMAAQNGMAKIAALMVEQGADIKKRSDSGGSLLHSAACGGNIELVSDLLTKGFSPNDQDKYGMTPLHLASAKNHAELFPIFQTKNLNINPLSKSGETPLDMAEKMQSREVIELLHSLGGKKGKTTAFENLGPLPVPEIDWRQGSELPSYIRNLDAVVVKGKIYAVGGYNEATHLTDANYQYDPITDTWKVKQKLLNPGSNLAACALDNKIYVFGGNSREAESEVYDPGTDSWEKIPPLPTPRFHINGAAATVSGKIYVVGGAEKWFVISDKNEAFDPSSNSWTDCAPLPTPRQGNLLAAVNGKLYAIGGHGCYPPLLQQMRVVEAYDPGLDSWERKADLPKKGFPVGSVVLSNKIFVFLQTGLLEEEKTELFIYDPALDAWSRSIDIPRSVRLAGIAVVGEEIVIIGGGNSKEFFPTPLIGKVRFGR